MTIEGKAIDITKEIGAFSAPTDGDEIEIDLGFYKLTVVDHTTYGKNRGIGGIAKIISPKPFSFLSVYGNTKGMKHSQYDNSYVYELDLKRNDNLYISFKQLAQGGLQSIHIIHKA